ncbi:LmeA family phospholipid-binding protein [Mycolicibacterium mageritense]
MPPPPQRPGQPGWRGPQRPPPDPATQRLPRPGRPPEPPTQQLRAPRPPVDTAATEQLRAPRRPDVAATEKIGVARPGGAAPPSGVKKRRLRGWQSVLLIAVIVAALVVGGLAAAELYARHRAGTLLADVTQCVVEDGATISFGVNPPFLWQHITGHYTNLSVETGGNQVQAAKGMTADVTLTDIRLQGTQDSKGTIGSLTATLAWTAAGIKDTVADNLPGVGNLITDVKTDPSAGTLILDAAGGTSITAEPVVQDGDLGLHVLDVTGPFSKETVQTALDELTKKLNDNYPLGIHADSVTVTDTGVVGKFSSENASIPTGDSNACFERL